MTDSDDRMLTTREVLDRLRISYTTLVRHLVQPGFLRVIERIPGSRTGGYLWRLGDVTSAEKAWRGGGRVEERPLMGPEFRRQQDAKWRNR